MEEKIREVVEQALNQQEQEQEIQMLTEQVEELQKENDFLTFISLLFFLVIVSYFAINFIVSTIKGA